MSDEKVVFLAYSSPKAVADSIVLTACGVCRNKTFTLHHDGEESFPMLRCAACGAHIGRVGWAQEEDSNGL